MCISRFQFPPFSPHLSLSLPPPLSLPLSSCLLNGRTRNSNMYHVHHTHTNALLFNTTSIITHSQRMIIYSCTLCTHTHTRIVPADPVSDLTVTAVTETSVSLSWMTGFDGFTPITAIEILVTPERGDPPSTNPIVLPPSNQTIISNLLPFRAHEFSVAVRNLAGISERNNINASTLSLRKLNIDS